MTYSLNETQALCRKAARGAGYTWGLADEAGAAARWLETRGLAGLDALACLLEATAGQDLTCMTPRIDGPWQADLPLCPIIAGAALADHAHLLRAAPVRLASTRCPLLLLPFVDRLARHGAVQVTWAGAHAWLGPHGTHTDGPLGASNVAEVRITPGQAPGPAQQQVRLTRCCMSTDLYFRLNTFAERTYAPATEASRLAGAGAGLTDND